MKLFELYEARKNRFKPGIVWRDKSSHMVKELEIVSNDNLRTRLYHMVTDYDRTNGDRVTFRIITSKYASGESLAAGRYVSWDKKYMEDCYEPVLSKL